ncbi:MAG TPA: response regulator [Armatimonadota bacterium]|jgi:CheY-like chemotaxis protein
MSNPKRVLIADAEPLIAGLISRALQEVGYDTAQVYGGEEAIRWLSESPPPDLVICDYRMPGIDGAEVRDWMMEDRQLARIPFILMTGKTSSFKGWFEKPTNFTLFLTKPFQAQEVVIFARRALEAEAGASE